ncbi:alkylation response protein AidB-like acyl-CoA dehydrogenase [Sinobacterium caligoides]|uniref:Alkylation response protein AidB-like acyl-CoA dehydrogenase n=1 Tax=Sinobacterium caligoides TaxID=933926 RepID=A0A3N2DQ13_9GAMM|nr:acyl-CoA dehydrogenase family protein [Sinobacterium caligoides]ROS01906.1 alkylation response protein AidB-like acyl-CoA dehydrogenase [Sinobacterium caligoides]
MEFSFSEDQTAIQDLAHQIFTDQLTDEYLLEYDRGDNDYDTKLWALLAEQGLLGLAVPESCGGSGLGFMELALVLQEGGRRVAPLPLLSNLVLAGLPITEFGSSAQQQQYLSAMASGEKQLTAAIAEVAISDAVASVVSVAKSGAAFTLSGEKQAVPYGAQANTILVPAVDGNGATSVFLVDTAAEGVSVTAQQTAFGNTLATVRLENVVAELLGNEGEGEQIVSWIEQYANAAISAMQVGLCDEALKRTAEFTCERKQFGAPIGAFQAVAMRAADAYIDIEAMRSTFWQAAWRLSEQLEATTEVRAAKYWACMGGHRVVHACQHLHGGMGSDVEFPIHRYFLHAKNNEFLLGGAQTQLSAIGELLASSDQTGATWLAV